MLSLFVGSLCPCWNAVSAVHPELFGMIFVIVESDVSDFNDLAASPGCRIFLIETFVEILDVELWFFFNDSLF